MIYIKVKDTEMGKNSRVIFFDRHRTAELSGSYDFMGLPASVLETNPVFTAHAAAESQALARAESAAVHNTTPVAAASSTGASVDSSSAVSSADNNSTASFAGISTASYVGSSTDSAADNGSVVSTADNSMASLEVAAADLVIVPAALNVSESLIITPAAELQLELCIRACCGRCACC